ncbi:MAG: glycosyltransferase [Salinivirgaceae bacterium]|nr:glycosyltransferase [Salinivirgaceae bacterium]
MALYLVIWVITVVFITTYAVVIFFVTKGWTRLKHFQASAHDTHTKVSIIVPFRNESEHLTHCLDSLINQSFPVSDLEIILVDDLSSDDSKEIAQECSRQNPHVVYLRNQNPGKKGALEYGILYSKGELLVTVDADSEYPLNWLHTLVQYYEMHHADLIIGSMQLKTGTSWFQKFQALEYISLMGTTAGAAGINRPVMCNGANLAFKKEVYQRFSDPFKREYISGDDVFLLHQFKRTDPSKIHYLKSPETVVLTNGADNLKAFLKQRFRWASKAPGYRDFDTLFIAGVVLGVAFSLILTMLLAFFNIQYVMLFLCLFSIKTMVDLWFFTHVLHFFGKLSSLLMYLPFFELAHALYVLVASVSVLFPIVRWNKN